MNRYLVISAVGRDRPGLVDRIAAHLLERDANIEDSRMAVLGGSFALILLVAVSQDGAARIEQDRADLEQETALSIMVRPTDAPESRRGRRALPLHVSAMALDHPGILRPIARALAELDVNVAALETRTTPAPHTGSPVFCLEMDLEVPESLPVQRVRESLSALADELNMDLTIHATSRP